MQLKKGPYGCFLTETITLDHFSRYSGEIIEKFVYYNTVTVNAYEANNSVELSYDISNLISISDFVKESKNQATAIEIVRKMMGQLLTNIIQGLDLLLSPDNWLIDVTRIFYDEESSTVRFIYIPQTSGASNMYLSSLSGNNFENFINDEVIKPYLSEDEINSILFFIKENEEQKLLEVAKKLSSDSKNKHSDKTYSNNTNNSFVQFTCILLIITLGLYNYSRINKTTGIMILASSLLAVLISLPIGRIKSFFTSLMNKKSETSDIRTDILFGKENDNLDFEYAILSSISKINGKFIRKSLISDIITIGSDCFLSDIVIDSSDISPLHACISIRDGIYLLKDLSISNTTFIENKKIIPDKEYEIKNGQILSFGNYDFEFKTKEIT